MLLQTQFWDTDPSTGPSDAWTIHGLWYVHITYISLLFANFIGLITVMVVTNPLAIALELIQTFPISSKLKVAMICYLTVSNSNIKPIISACVHTNIE